MKPISIGDKIYKLRTELGLTQDDIANEEISKSLISMIEKGRRGLTFSTATIVAKSLNKYYGTIGREITLEYLMETEEEQVAKFIGAEMEQLKETLNSNDKEDLKQAQLLFDKIKVILVEWNFSKETAEFQLLKAKYYCKLFQYNNAITEYFKALEYFIGKKVHYQVANIYLKVGICYYMQLMLEQALIHYTMAYNTVIAHNPENKEEIKMITTFNQILCYRKLNKYDMALQYISIFKEENWNYAENKAYRGQVELVEANTLRDIKNYDKAEKMYLKLIDKARALNDYTLYITLISFAELYRNKEEYKTALYYIDKAFELKDRVELEYIPTGMLEKSKCLIDSKKYNEALSSLTSGLALAIQYNRNDDIIEIQFTIVQLYLRFIKDYKSALKHLQDSEKIIIENAITSKKERLNALYAELYIEMNDTVKCLEYIRNMQNVVI